MEYQNTILCCGNSNKMTPCKYIEKCDFCAGPYVDEYGNEEYVIALGVPGFKCKRDNPNYSSLEEQFEQYRKQ